MRNLFDQYRHPENRLSHALAVCLNEDRALLRGFLSWIGVAFPANLKTLNVVEQTLPGDPPESDEEAERRGLPDIIIHDGNTWCVLIESKIQAPLTSDQLARHEKTMRRRGFECIACVALTKAGVVPPSGVIGRAWCGLYEWLAKTGGGREWAERLRAYLRVAELRLAREEYLTEGTLTMFDGFPFSDENPYTYEEARRLLNLAMAELRKDKSLQALGVDTKADGRRAIMGDWDYLLLKNHPAGKPHTAFPHFSLGAFEYDLIIAVTIPNDAPNGLRRLVDIGSDGLRSVNGAILKRAARLRRLGGRVEAYAVQRHWKSRRSEPDVDARVEFDLETSQTSGVGQVKCQPEWVGLFVSLIGAKASNIQFGYKVCLPWETRGLNTRESLKMIAEGWSAMEPLLDVLRGKDVPSRR
jgi:hypothetical protein